jgi:predicted PurR-regulated permease PerM
MRRNKHARYFGIGIIAVLGLLSLLVVLPYFIPLVSGVIFAYIFRPVYKYFKKELKNNMVASLLTILVSIIIIILPFLFLMNSLVGEANEMYFYAIEYLDDNSLNINEISLRIQETFGLSVNIEEVAKDLASVIIAGAQEFLKSFPKKVLDMFITFFTMYYLLINWDFLKRKARETVPVEKKVQNKFTRQFENITYALVYSQIVIAMVQGAVGGVGFWIFGINNPIMWGIIMAVLALLPVIGPPIVWVPAVIFLFLKGNIWPAVGLGIYSAFLTSGIDNILRPYIVEKKAKVHPVLVLVGILGGLSLFGVMGIIIGPIILAATFTAIEVFAKEI